MYFLFPHRVLLLTLQIYIFNVRSKQLFFLNYLNYYFCCCSCVFEGWCTKAWKTSTFHLVKCILSESMVMIMFITMVMVIPRFHLDAESAWVSLIVLHIFEVQMCWHGSIDGCAGDIYGLWLGQQNWKHHLNACSTGTLGHMPLPLQPFCSSPSPQSLADEWHDLPSLSTGHVDQEGVTVAVRQGEQYWLK